MKLLRLLCYDRTNAFGDPYQTNEAWSLSWKKLRFPLLLLLTAVASVFVSVLIMYSISDLIVSFNNNELPLFVATVWKTLGLVTIQAIATALKAYFADCSAVEWRVCLDRELFHRIKLFHRLTRTWGDGNKANSSTVPYNEDLEGLDQRLSQDIIDFTTKSALLYEKVIVLPAIIIFYTFYIYVELGLMSVLLCLLYFLLGSSLSMFIAKSIAPLIYQQAKLEAVFRYSCTFYMKHLSTIVFIGGGEREIEKMLQFFEEAISNKTLLVTKELWVRVSTQWFAYAGSVVSYSIVGFSILFPVKTYGFAWTAGAKTDFSATKNARLKAWSKGSYACMSLINAFSTAVDTVTLFSEAKGLYLRIDQLIDCVDSASQSLLVMNQHDVESSSKANLFRDTANNESSTFNRMRFLLSSSVAWLPHRWSVTVKKANDYDVITSNTMFIDEALDDDVEGSEPDQLGLSYPSTLRAPLMTSSTPLVALQSRSSSISADTQQRSGNHNIVLEISNYRLCTLDQRKTLLPSLSMTMVKGMRVLITGPTGCGKSTLLQMIASMIRQLHGNRLDIQLAVCPQMPYILHQGTVRENLRYPHAVKAVTALADGMDAGSNRSCDQVTDKEVWSLKAAMLEDFIPNLYDTNHSSTYIDVQTVDGSGPPYLSVCERMSTGQRQCLAVARLLYHSDSKMVACLDEITSGMDEFTEEAVYKSIVQHVPTFISVGHRSSVKKFHSHELHICKDGHYTFVALS